MRTIFGKKQLASAVVLALFGSAGAALVGGTSFVAKASPRPTVCYRIPEKDEPFASEQATKERDVWCYKELEEPQGATLIYKPDDKGKMKPELSLIVEADGTMTHGSMNGGQLSVHSLAGDEGFNPIGAPLTPPEGAERINEPISPTSAESVEEGIKVFEQEHGNVTVYPAIVTPGTVTVQADHLPWRGYWFPYSTDRLHKGDNSPLAKYDKFIARRAASTNPGSQAWEHRNHNYGVGWSGHCNGWAAASTMTPEPTKPITDPYSGVTFSVSDLKGLLIERNYCPKIVFFGSRNWGKPGNDPSDIRPSTFHNVITYFIGVLKKPVLVDLMASPAVQNSVISGYTMKTTKTGSNSYVVEMKATVHLYDNQLSEETGVARSMTRTYRYTLRTNNDGRVVGGSWLSSNPDFLWVPLSAGECRDRNQIVDQFWVDEIFRFGK